MDIYNFQQPRLSSSPKYNEGVTLIELLVAMSILAILAAAAFPAMQATITSNAVSSEASRFVAALQLARSEAVKRNQSVVLERLSGANQTWEEGLRIFHDISGEDGGSTFTAANDTLIRSINPSSNGLSVRSNNVGDQLIAFRGNGMSSLNNTIVFHVCHQNNVADGRRITINVGGRAFVDDIPANQTCTPP